MIFSRLSVALAVLSFGVCCRNARAYSLSGSKWATPTVTMHLQLGASSTPLSDGFASWGAAAEDALTVWNGQIAATKFAVVRDSTAARAERNRINNVFFSGNIYGDAWGANVLAVTLIYSSGSSTTETDVLFNNGLTWNSYRGGMRYSTSGAPIYDFHRVAMHEFGHVLGLDHPDDKGQTVSALMNSHISSLDALTGDDISGAQSLYGAIAAAVQPPVILTQPASRTVAAGQSTTFTVVASSTAALSYQWLKAGVAINGANAASYTLASPSVADAGNYSVAVTNSGGTTTSAVATLTVTVPTTPTTPTTPTSPTTPSITAPVILAAPSSQSANVGTAVTFSVSASGTAPLTYVWRKDGSVIAGATTSALSLLNVQPANAGSYAVSVSNSAGTATSAPATLVIQVAPTILASPADQTVPVGSPLALSVTAAGASPLTYQWRKDGAPVAGATGSTYQVAAVQTRDAGSYSAVVTNPAGGATSGVARVTVVSAPPVATTLPASQTVKSGERVTFTAAAGGTAPFSYQWLKNGTEIPGATAANLTLEIARPVDAAEYAVRISNVGGSIVTPAATLTVRWSRLVNLSTRAFVPAGTTMTPGFFVRGTGSKPVLIRAVGPTLRRFGIENALAATQLDLVPQGASSPLASTDASATVDLGSAFAQVGAFPLQPDAKDAAMEANLIPRGYTVRVSPPDTTMLGVALAEIYDAEASAPTAQLVNVSTLGFVGAGENVLTAGFVISGDAPKKLLIRAIGPGLASFGVANFLPDPQVALLPQGAAEPFAMNDDWPDAAALRNAFADAGAFSLVAGSKDGALLVTLEPGAYTVIVSSVTAAVTGQALVEIYDLDP